MQLKYCLYNTLYHRKNYKLKYNKNYKFIQWHVFVLKKSYSILVSVFLLKNIFKPFIKKYVLPS